MTVPELVAHLRGLDVRAAGADGDRLRLSAPKGVLSDELREQLSTRKAEILTWLREHAPAEAEASGREAMSFAQQRIWFMDQLSPGGFAYNITGGLRIEGPLDVPALERALGELIRRHESLRTVFVAVEDSRCRWCNRPTTFACPSSTSPRSRSRLARRSVAA